MHKYTVFNFARQREQISNLFLKPVRSKPVYFLKAGALTNGIVVSFL